MNQPQEDPKELTIEEIERSFNHLPDIHSIALTWASKLAKQRSDAYWKYKMIEEVEKAVDFYEVSALKMPKWTERELYIKKLKEKYGIV